MRKIAFAFSLLFLANLSVYAQSTWQEKVLFTVEDDSVSAEEFMAVFNKNRDIGEDIDPKTPREYLDLYINFKLKVHEAKELGRDTLPNFKREFNNYREQLMKPYLSDKEVTNELVREAYRRMKYDVRASHIMVALPKDPSPEDTLKAYNKIMSLRKEVLANNNFQEVASASSDDTYSARQGGDLGYFTVFDMVYPFESAAYNTPVGSLSEPVRSQFGYHIVKPTDKRAARGKLTVAHIMLIENEKSTNAQKDEIKARIDEIYGKIKAGESFELLVKQYSEDKTSIPRQGQLDPFGINKMYPEFEEAAFALENVGDISEPVKTPVGWHIIKLIEKPSIPDFESAQSDLRNKVERDLRAQQSSVSVMRRIKMDYQYKEYPKLNRRAFDYVSEDLLQAKFEAPNKGKYLNSVLFSFANQEFTVSNFLDWLTKRQKAYARGSNLRGQLNKALNDYKDQMLLDYEKSRLSTKYAEFRLLEREYYEGILLFDLTEEKVWRRALNDTTGLQEFFENNRDQYTWGMRFNLYQVDAADKKTCKKAINYLKKGKTIAEVKEKLNVDSKLALAVDSGLFEVEQLKIKIDESQEPGKTELQEINGRFVQAYIKTVTLPMRKTLKEAKGKVISDYQTYLEQAWIEDLKAKYEVSVSEQVMNEVEAKLNE